MSDPESVATSITAEHQMAQQLTESILTLQQTIKNVQEDVRNGIAPSILLPVNPDQDISTGMVMLTLEPSSADIQAHLTPLETRLEGLESKLRNLNLWHPPPIPPKSPEYSIIDVSDLSSAITLLESVFNQQFSNLKPSSARLFFAKHHWTWDPLHHEFRTSLDTKSIYLSSWRFDDQRQVWEYVSMAGVNMSPEDAVQWIGSWEDWKWDPAWKEWFLDVGDGERDARVYASMWEARREEYDDEVEWVYVGGTVQNQ